MAVLDNDWWLDEVHNKIWAIRQAGPPQNESDRPEAIETIPGSAQKRKRSARPTSDLRQHVLTEDGKYRVNRQGIPLCKEFNEGGCNKKLGRCPHDRNKVHQCHKCLRMHAGNSCNETPRPPSAAKAR
eukprot:2941740-Amphidinium_carterae.1